MNINITYDKGLSLLTQRIESGIGEIVTAAGECVRESAKEICPVDTGALRDSISVDCTGGKAVVSANTDYAAYVEFGTSKRAPKPYLVPSLINNEDKIKSAMLDAVRSDFI